MEKLLVKLMILSALLELGLTIWNFRQCVSRECALLFEKRSRDVLKIDWKPISVFPEEGRVFNQKNREFGSPPRN